MNSVNVCAADVAGAAPPAGVPPRDLPALAGKCSPSPHYSYINIQTVSVVGSVHVDYYVYYDLLQFYLNEYKRLVSFIFVLS